MLEARYEDEHRSHEVFTLLEPSGSGVRLTVVEVPHGSRDPLDAVSHAEVLESAWDARLAVLDVESRLAATGVRHRRTLLATGETIEIPFARGASTPPPTVAPLPGGRTIRYHTFHRGDGETRVELAVPRVDLGATRFLLGRLDFRFPDVDRGDLRVLHARLSEGTLRQAWAEAHHELPRLGYRHLATPVDYALALGPDWRDRWAGAWQGLVRRLLDGGLGRPEPAPAAAPAPVPDGALAVLTSPEVAAVERAHLQPGEAERLVDAGEFRIRRFIESRRRLVPHGVQPDLSLLEAALLLRHGRARGLPRVVAEQAERAERLVRLRRR